MMGTEKLNRHFVGTALMSVLLSLLLALTPVLAVAEPANGGNASADAAEAAPAEDDAAEAAEDVSADAASAVSPQPESSVSADTTAAITSAESTSASPASANAIAPASATEVIVPTTITSSNASTTPLSATLTYNGNFAKGDTVRFTYNVAGNERPLLYRLFSFSIKSGDSWTDVIDITKSSYGAYSPTTNYFEEKLYNAGTYRVVFQAVEYTDNGDGTKTLGDYARFQAQFTVSESGDFKSMDTTISDIVAQCNSECAKQDDTSDYAKALWLNDWVIDNTEYDNTYTYINAEGVFGRGLGDCEAYHDAYVRLLNKVGIETRRVDSTGDNHVWTGAKLDGKWYNIDTTWNDMNYTYGNLDLRHLYFAVPTNVMKLVHKNWDGTYSLGYPNRAAFDAESYEDNYFIKSGEIDKFTAPYLEASGTYSVKAHLDARETSFTIPVAKSGWPDSYKNVIYNLVAYRLGQENWGSGIKVGVTYADNTLSFQATYDGSQPSISIDDAVVSNVANRPYTGSLLTPRPTVTVGSTTLREGTDYFLSYANNTSVGTATITIKGAGNYTGTATKTFAIVPRSISDTAVSGAAAQTYTGNALTPKPTVKVGSATLKEGSDYSLSYKNNTSVGAATITITGKGNYTGTTTETFAIRPASIPVSAVGSVPTQTYAGKALTPKPTVKVGATTLREGADYTLSHKNNTNAGTASVTVTGKGNYTGDVTKTFTIAKRSISGATVSVATQTYTGSALTPKPTVKVGSTTLREGADYSLSYKNNTNVGTATVTITGKGNYTDTRPATFRIEPKPGASTGGGSGSSTAPSGVAMHRLYNPNSGEHFYTASAHERDSLRRAGWKYEGVGWTAPASSRTPVYRLYSGTDHHYTASAAERDMLVRAGWKYEGVGWYSDDAKGVPLYRQFNPNVNPGAPRNNSGSHNYTTSRAEHDHLVSAGWRGEGIGWYGM